MTWIKRGAFAVVVLLAIGFGVGSLGGTASDMAGTAEQLARRGGVAGFQADGFQADGVQADGFQERGLSAKDATIERREDAPPSAQTAGPMLPLGDRIIRTGELAVEVREGGFDEAWKAALRLAQRLDGSVLTSSSGSITDERIPSGEITIRVPSDRFEDALIGLRALGEVRNDQTSSQDVTEEYIDLRARLRHLRAQETVLLRLMARATSIQDTITVQSQLSEIQLEIERIVGRLNYLDARTEFSTITTRLAEPGGFLGSTPPSDDPSFSRAWDTALMGLKRMATAGMIAGLWLAPFIAIAAAGSWAFGRGRRPVPVIDEPAPQA